MPHEFIREPQFLVRIVYPVEPDNDSVRKIPAFRETLAVQGLDLDVETERAAGRDLLEKNLRGYLESRALVLQEGVVVADGAIH